jgi:hypothetical protein
MLIMRIVLGGPWAVGTTRLTGTDDEIGSEPCSVGGGDITAAPSAPPVDGSSQLSEGLPELPRNFASSVAARVSQSVCANALGVRIRCRESGE